MSKMDSNKNGRMSGKDESLKGNDATNVQNEQENKTDEISQTDIVSDELEILQKKYDELNDSHLRLMAEFDNYRKRTLREKAELIKSGAESALANLLPVVDDFERALQNIHNGENLSAVEEGVELIYNKLIAYLSQQGVKPIDAMGKDFDTEMFEAVATIPASTPDLKGKVVDCVQTGYTLYEKVLRHAKVVVGE